ncbi:MAG: hypothetical protein KA198_02630 [Chitinophagaceae bacterium]|nr:hypothetical protein [Chitinophagaceae bacterium]
MALLKMTLLSFRSFDIKDMLKPRIFFAMFNPASYKVEYSFTKDETKTGGASNQTAYLTAINKRKMTFDFLIDGTGANGDERIVLLEAKKFETIVMPEKKDFLAIVAKESEQIQLPKLLLLWGTFMFTCEIESYSVNYTLFNQFGIPLRATISATFSEVIANPNPDILSMSSDIGAVDTVTNVASFLSTAYTITNNVGAAIEMGREQNLSSIRGQVNIKK